MDDEERMAWGAIGFGVGWAVNQFTKKPESFNNPLEDMWLTVIFPDYTEQVANLQALFRQQGVYFDTAFGPEGREWNLDFSLEGATTRQVLRVLNRRGLKYKISDVREQGFYSDGKPHLANELNYSEDDEEELFINPKIRRAPIIEDSPWWHEYTWSVDDIDYAEGTIVGEVIDTESDRPVKWFFEKADNGTMVWNGNYVVSMQGRLNNYTSFNLGWDEVEDSWWNEYAPTDSDSRLSLTDGGIEGQLMLDEINDDAMKYIMKKSNETDGFTANPKVRRLSGDAVDSSENGLLEYFNFEDLTDVDVDAHNVDEAKQALGVPKRERQMNDDDEEKNTLMNIKYLISEIRIDEIDDGIVRIAVYAKTDSAFKGSYMHMDYNVMTEERLDRTYNSRNLDHRTGFIEMARSILLDDEGWSEVFGNELYSMFW